MFDQSGKGFLLAHFAAVCPGLRIGWCLGGSEKYLTILKQVLSCMKMQRYRALYYMLSFPHCLPSFASQVYTCCLFIELDTSWTWHDQGPHSIFRVQ